MNNFTLMIHDKTVMLIFGKINANKGCHDDTTL